MAITWECKAPEDKTEARPVSSSAAASSNDIVAPATITSMEVAEGALEELDRVVE